MSTTKDMAAIKKQRDEWQRMLRDKDRYKAELDRVTQELKMAQQEVAEHKRTPGYVADFERSFATAAQRFNDLNSVVPNQLVNSCTDRGLKDSFELSVSIRSQMIAEVQAARDALKRAEQDLHSTRARIRELLGEPGVLKTGDALPWLRTTIEKVHGAFKAGLGITDIPRWSISEDNERIEFGPDVHESTAPFYREQWLDDLKSIRFAKAKLAGSEQRLKDAEATLAQVKSEMIWSPI